MDLNGQVAVITGGAGGIGWSSAQRWLAQGGKVVLADLQVSRGKELAAASDGRVVFVQCDCRLRRDLENAAASAMKLGVLTCWFNNAGFAIAADTAHSLESSGFTDDLKNMLDVNLGAYIEGTGVALRYFDKSRGGTIINTASMAGVLPLGAPPVYSTTKAAVIHFTRSMGLTLGDKSKIRLYCLCPSYTATAQGPPVNHIRSALGGVLRADHMGEGFIMLVNQRPANGSVMRVTARNRGRTVVHDILRYGREQGGMEPAREAFVMKEAPLVAVSDEDGASLDATNLERRTHEGMWPLSKAKL